MARICEITGKKPRVGNHVSHAKNKSKRWFYPNLQVKRFFLAEEGIWVTLKVSTSVLRTINKKGLNIVLKDSRKRGTLAKDLGCLVANKLHGAAAKLVT
ncbi:MAG: hypothetical protein RL012_341 [Bacteroidota bacterium]|jgi:large subunit ribosomal protein L28